MNDLEEWLVQIFTRPTDGLEPVQGEWGMLYAGSIDKETSYLSFPDFDIDLILDTGLLYAGRDDVPNLGNVFTLKWPFRDSDIALPFVYDFIHSANLFDNPLYVLENKKRVWRVFDNPDKLKSNFSKLIGLWGEMNFVIRNPFSAPFWTGPLGTDADIESEEFVIEIKTTRKKTFDSVTISSLWQLEDKNRKLFLPVLSIGPKSDNGQSLHDLRNNKIISGLKQRLLNKIDAEMDSFGPDLCNLKFSLRDMNIYPVNDSFPRLSKSILKNCLSKKTLDRVLRLNYTISLPGLATISEEQLNIMFA